MKNKIKALPLCLLAVSLITIYFLGKKVKLLKQERDRHSANTEALLSEVKRLKIDSCTTVTTVKTLILSIDEYKKYRTADIATIKKMGLRIKDLEAVGKHQITVEAPIHAELADSIILHDTVSILVRRVEMNTPYLKLVGVIENNHLTGNVKLPIHLHQAIWLEYRHRFLWWRWKVKAVHQSISCDNPYAQISYSEFINIKK